MATPIAVLSILVNANTSAATASLARTDAQLKRTAVSAKATSASLGSRLGGAAKSAGKYLGMGAGVGLGYALYKGVEAGVSFEKQMDSVAAVANANAKEFKSLERQALKLGQSTAFSASEVATAQGELAKGGLAVKDILGGALPAALKLAAAGEMDLGEAAETTVNSMKLFALSGKDATAIADMLATAANTTTADVSDFAMALKQGGSIAKQAGLNLNDTVTVLEALAEAGIKNSDAGTSMKTAFLQLLAPTDKQRSLMERLNLQVIDHNGNLKDAAGLSSELQQALGGMTNAQQAANLKVLAGTDGFRTLAALYDAGPEKLKKLSEANLEQGTAQEIAKKKMDNTAGSLEQLSGALETLSIKMFKSAQSPFRDFIDGATKAVKQFTDIVTDKKLTSDEKISKVMEMVSGAVEDALPKIAKAGAQIGSTLAKAIVNSFINGDILTRLFIGGMVIKAMGGFEAIKTMGKTSGKVFGRGWVAGVILALPLILPEAYKIGKQIGQQLRKGIGDLAGWIKDELAGDTIKDISDKIANAPLAWAKKWSEAGFSFGTIVDQLTDAGVAADKAARITDKAMHSVQDGYGKSGDAARKYAERAKDGLDKSGDAADKNAGKRIPKSLSTANKSMSESERATDSLRSKASTNFGKVGDASAKQSGRVASNNASMVNAVGKGQEILRDNTNKALKAYGVKEINFTAKTVAGGIGKAADILGLQRGGPINLGAPSGDSVPAMLERGEYVLNRKAVAAVGQRKLDAINFGHAPRFQTGGIVEQALGPYDIPPIQYDPNHAGSNSHLHLDFFTQAQAIAVGKKMQQMGWNIGEYSGPYGGFSGITTHHQSPGHYDGTAFDANTAADETRSEVEAVVRLLGGGGAAMVDKIKRVLLEGPEGPLRTGGQAALDKVRSAANAFIKKHSATSVGGGVNVGGGVVSRSEMRSLLKANQLPDIMGWVAGAETNWDPSLVNSIGATGLFQILVSAHQDLNSKYNLLDAGENTAAAATLYRANGLSDWVASQNEGGLPFGNGGWGQMVGKPFRKGGLVGMQSGGAVDHIQDLYSKLGKTDDPKRRKKIENRIKRAQRDLKKAQGHRLHKKLGRIKDNGAMPGIVKEVNKRQEVVDTLTEYIGRMETNHAFTEMRDVSAILEESGIDPNIDLGTLTKAQQDALTGALDSDVSVEKGEINAEIALNYQKLLALFELRSQLIAGIEKAKERIKKAVKQMEQAAKVEEKARKDARKLEHSIGRLQKNLETLREKDPPERGKHESKDAYDKRVKRWRHEHQDKALKISDRIAKQRFALSQAKKAEGSAHRIGETAKTARENLTTTSTQFMDSLIVTQGLGSSMDANVVVLPLGSGLPQFGGDILTTQDKLRTLGATSITAPKLDFTPPKPDTSELDALKYEEALATIRRLTVGIAQNAVFQGAFAAGGVVPGKGLVLVGEQGPELMAVNGGERVFSNSESRSMLEPQAREIQLRVVHEDNRTRYFVDDKEVKAIVRDEMGRVVRNRPFAGAGQIGGGQ